MVMLAFENRCDYQYLKWNHLDIHLQIENLSEMVGNPKMMLLCMMIMLIEFSVVV